MPLFISHPRALCLYLSSMQDDHTYPLKPGDCMSLCDSTIQSGHDSWLVMALSKLKAVLHFEEQQQYLARSVR